MSETKYFPIKKLYRNLLNHTAEFLCWLDVYSLRLSFKSDIKQHDFKEIVRKRLERRDVNTERFFKAMLNYNAVISGSFLLECMLGIDFKPMTREYKATHDEDGNRTSEPVNNIVELEDNVTDVDLYLMGKEREVTESDIARARNNIVSGQKIRWYEDKGFLIEANPMGHDEKKICYFGTDEDRQPRFPIVHQVYSMMKHEKVVFRLDYIRVDPSRFNSLSSFIAINFDITICMNMFDGNKLKIKHLDDLLERKFTARLPPELDYGIMGGYNVDEKDRGKVVINSLGVADRRVQKYEHRGFKLVKRETFQERLESMKAEHKEMKEKLDKLRGITDKMYEDVRRDRRLFEIDEFLDKQKRLMEELRKVDLAHYNLGAALENLSRPIKE